VCLWRWAFSWCLGGSVPPSPLLLPLHELWKSIPPSELHKEFFFLIFLEDFSAARQPVRWTSRSLVAAVIIAVIDECSSSSSSGRWSVIRLSAWVAAGLVLPAAATYLGRAGARASDWNSGWSGTLQL
jgi:hypothetical protein